MYMQLKVSSHERKDKPILHYIQSYGGILQLAAESLHVRTVLIAGFLQLVAEGLQLIEVFIAGFLQLVAESPHVLTVLIAEALRVIAVLLQNGLLAIEQG